MNATFDLVAVISLDQHWRVKKLITFAVDKHLRKSDSGKQELKGEWTGGGIQERQDECH